MCSRQLLAENNTIFFNSKAPEENYLRQDKILRNTKGIMHKQLATTFKIKNKRHFCKDLQVYNPKLIAITGAKR